MINGDTLPKKTISREHVRTSCRQSLYIRVRLNLPLISLCPFGIHHRIVGDSISKRTSINVYLTNSTISGTFLRHFFYLSGALLCRTAEEDDRKDKKFISARITSLIHYIPLVMNEIFQNMRLRNETSMNEAFFLSSRFCPRECFCVCCAIHAQHHFSGAYLVCLLRLFFWHFWHCFRL